jgi:hypothetical protein
MVRQPIAVIVASAARHITSKPHLASPRSPGRAARLVMVLICLAGGLVAGCGGAASQQALTAQALAQKQAPPGRTRSSKSNCWSRPPRRRW